MDSLRIGSIQRISSEERSRVTKSLEAAQKEVRDLVFTLNSANLAVILPEETLSEIFMHLQLLWGQDKEPKTHVQEEYQDVHSWTVTTAVCKRWRDVALGNPALWTDIRVVNPAFVRLCLEKSQDMLLDVEGILPTEDNMHSTNAWRSVLKHSHRIRTLCFNHNDDGYTTLDDPEEDDCPKFPELRTLLLRLHEDGNGWTLNEMFVNLCIDPALETLEVRGTNISYALQLVSPRLRHLELHYTRFDLNTPSLEVLTKLYDALKALPQLQSLKLISIFPADAPLDIPPAASVCFDKLPLILGKPVDMPHLSSVCVDQDTGTLAPAVLIRHLNLSPITSIELSTDECNTEEVDLLVALLRTRMTASAKATPSAPARTLAIHDYHFEPEDTFGTVLACWTQDIAVSLDYARSVTLEAVFTTQEACLYKIYHYDHATLGEITVEGVVRSIPIESFRCISLGCNWPSQNIFLPLSEGKWEALATATEVDTLVVQAGWTEELPKILSPGDNNELLFPKLHTIHIVDHNLLVSEKDQAFVPPAAAHKMWMRTLLDVLWCRSGATGRLKQIFVTRSKGFTPEDIQELKEHADEVIWNGAM